MGVNKFYGLVDVGILLLLLSLSVCVCVRGLTERGVNEGINMGVNKCYGSVDVGILVRVKADTNKVSRG